MSGIDVLPSGTPPPSTGDDGGVLELQAAANMAGLSIQKNRGMAKDLFP
jgi:hypothetical protein